MSIYGDNIFTINEATNKEVYSSINFFDKEFNIMISDYYDNKQLIKNNDSKIKSALKAFCNKSLWTYLYSISKKWIDEVNRDPYYDGMKCNNADDLINAIKNNSSNDKKGLSLFVKEKKGNIIIYICGEYWLDDEHGFSVSFPDGKIVKCKGSSYTNDEYINSTCTLLAGYDMAL